MSISTGFERLSLDGRTAIVTGSSRNLGRTTVELLASRGANVVVHASSSKTEVDSVVDGIRGRGGRAVGVLADLSDVDSTQRLVDAAVGEFGGLDIVVNNAAIRPHADFLDLSPAQWRAVMVVNLEAAYTLTQRGIPSMLKRGYGRIINISGLDAFWGKTGKAHVVAANMGLVGLTRSVAVEFAQHGVTANAVVPGAMNTSRPDAATFYPGYAARYRDLLQRIPVGRPGEPHELAEAVAFLSAPASSYITGQTWHVNGGGFPTAADPMGPPVALPEGLTFGNVTVDAKP